MPPIERLRLWWSDPANEGGVILVKLLFACSAIPIVCFVAYRVTLVVLS